MAMDFLTSAEMSGSGALIGGARQIKAKLLRVVPFYAMTHIAIDIDSRQELSNPQIAQLRI